MTRQNVRLIFAVIALVVIFKMLQRDRSQPGQGSGQIDRAAREVELLQARLQPPADAAAARDGLAAAIVIDVSGSMKDKVQGQSGQREEKIAIARRAALDLVDQFVGYARDHQD